MGIRAERSYTVKVMLVSDLASPSYQAVSRSWVMGMKPPMARAVPGALIQRA